MTSFIDFPENDIDRTVLNLDDEGPSAELTPEQQENRATKIDFGMSNQSPGLDKIISQLSSGNEEALKDTVSFQKSLEREEEKLKFSRELVDEVGKGQITQAEALGALQDIKGDEEVSKSTILEKVYAERVIDQAISQGNTDLADQAFNTNPQETIKVAEVNEFFLHRKEVAQNVFEEISNRDNGILSTASDFVETFIPFFSWWNMSDVKLSELLSGRSKVPFLLGNNIREQIEGLYLLPPDEFEQRLRQTIDEIAEENVFDAQNFAGAVVAFGGASSTFENIFTGIDTIDLVTVIPAVKLAKLAAKGAKRAIKKKRGIEPATDEAVAEAVAQTDGVTTKTDSQKLAQSLADTQKALNTKKPNDTEIVSSTGDVEKAAEVEVTKRLRRKAEGREVADLEELYSVVPSIFHPQFYKAKAHRLARNRIDKISRALEDSGDLLRQAIELPSTLQRLTPEALGRAFDEAEELVRNRYTTIKDSVLDVVEIDPEATVGRVGAVLFHLGKPDGGLFKNERQAVWYALNHFGFPKGAFNVRSQGGKFYVEIAQQLDETSPTVRQAQVATPDNETHASLINTVFGFIRNPDDIVSAFQRRNRKVATHLPQQLQKLLRDASGPFMKIAKNKKAMSRLQKILEDNRDFEVLNPETNKWEIGRFYQNIEGLSRAYNKAGFGPPSDDEIAAYFNYVQLSDFDWVFRNLGIFRDKSRQGIQNFSFNYTQPIQGDEAKSTFRPTPKMEGKEVDNVPWDDNEEVGVFVLGDSKPNNSGSFVNSKKATAETRANVEKLLSAGTHKVVQMASPVSRPFNGFLDIDDPITFMVVPKPAFSPLGFKQIPNRPGGHVRYRGGWFLKQPKFRVDSDGRRFYEGDTTLFNGSTRAEVESWTKNFNIARILLRENKLDELNDFLGKNLPFTVDEFEALFKRTDDLGNPLLDINTQSFTVRSGQGVNDTGQIKEILGDDVKDLVDSKFNLMKSVNKKYAGERDQALPTIIEGSEGNPVVQLDKAKRVTPQKTMNDALANVIRSRVLDDYKLSAMESWIQEFRNVLDVDIDELRADPLKFLHEPQFRADADASMKTAALNSRRAILNLLGTRNAVDEKIDFFLQRTADSIYKTAGQETSAYVAGTNLFNVKDPFKYARALAFHSKLGLFNPVQLILQAQSFTHIIGVAGPIKATQAAVVYPLMRHLAFTRDPKIVAHYGQIASKLGWKKEEFIESFNALRDSGLLNIEGEVSWRDDTLEPTIFQGRAGKFLDKGTFFFREGERFVRMSAWNAAYREWKSANPSKKLDAAAQNFIKDRTDTLFVNMTRSSNSALQQGVASIPTQFLSYQARLLEQFFSFNGRGLTVVEKVRAFATYSTLYGVPTAIGAAGGIWPWYDDIKQAGLERGMDLNNGVLEGLFHGVPDMLLELATGSELNFSERFGPGGLDVIKEAINGDATVLETLLGASGAIGSDFAGNFMPIVRDLRDVFAGEQGALRLLASDFVDATREVSSVNNVAKMYYALQTGKYISRNEIVIDDVTSTEAIFMGITGLQPRDMSDAFLILKSQKDIKKAQELPRKMFIKYFRKALNSESIEDKNAFLRRTKTWFNMGGFLPSDRVKLVRDALKGHEDLVDKVRRQHEFRLLLQGQE